MREGGTIPALKLMVFLILTAFLLIACENANDTTEESVSELPEEMPDEFDFSLKYGYNAANEINTYEDTYTKDLAADGDVTTDFELSSEEMQSIYDEMRSVDILNTPNYVSDMQCVDPHGENHLTITIDEETIEKDWISAMCDDTDEKLSEFIQYVHDEYIEPTEEYQELPEPTGGYD